jgi:hydrogenase maturation protein HypF
LTQKKSSDSDTRALLVHIKGRVQGVGFRPFVYRLAKQFALNGFVLNRTDGVIIHIEGPNSACSQYLELVQKNAPAAARIKEVVIAKVAEEKYKSFNILPSRQSEEIITEICPDIAVCDDCLRELYSVDRRNNYPFINCTNCGPRFTLIEDFPYDRKNTTMRDFKLCPDCSAEYHDLNDRRFHAQPVACPVCGPIYQYLWRDEIIDDFTSCIKLLGQHINEGKVTAIKGLGGYNLICDATRVKAVEEVRAFKNREKKPFAVMCRSIEALRKIAKPDKLEIETICSWQRPIVIIDRVTTKSFPLGITAGLNSLGVFLPYLPLHYLLFDEIQTNILVVTSGNESDTPILCEEEKAKEVFKKLSGGILINNRKIARRTDDSVIKIIRQNPSIFRRARGYVPAPVDLVFRAEGILATGAELSNCFCLGKGNQAIMSQHIGDLKNAETYDFFIENISEFSRMYRFKPKFVACDLHPDYLSTRYAEKLDIPVIRVQHHHAHITAVMAEHNLIDRVIGLSYDGSGYGTDSNIWGSELMVADYSSFERISHFEYIAIPGGDSAIREPWRSALAYLYRVFGSEWKNLTIPFNKKIDWVNADKLIVAIDRGINSPKSCSAGRLFDAIAALLMICYESDYHAQAPMLLENYIDPDCADTYSFTSSSEISFSPMIRSIVEDIIRKRSLYEIVSKFHNTLTLAAMEQVLGAYKVFNIKNIVLSGGTFQSKYLTEKLVFLLEQKQFKVFLPAEVPCNDGGIALGQLAVAANKYKE